jgi:hypothetical protein
MVEWLTLLLRIWEVPGSNPGTDTGYPDRYFVVFFTFSMLMSGQYFNIMWMKVVLMLVTGAGRVFIL